MISFYPLLALTLLCAVPENDVVCLRNGKVLLGTVHLDESNKEGFVLRPWDREASLFIRWNQLTATEIDRVLGRSAAPRRASADFIEGVSVHTRTRTVVGVLVREEPDRLSIKMSGSPAPVIVPKSSLLAPMERLAIPEAEAYSAEERIDRRLSRLAAGDVDGLSDLAAQASRLGLYQKAKELYLRVAAAEPARSGEIESLMAANEALARERRAALMLGEIGTLARKAEHAKAIALARTLLADCGETELARQNKDLISTLEKDEKEWTLRKNEVLARRVPEAYRQKLAERVSQASRLAKLAEARSLASTLHEDIVKELGDEMKSTPEEIRTAWSKRDRRVRTVGAGSGSWIILGGQSGGLDTEAKFQPVHRNTAKAAPPPIPLGLKLDTPEDWWEKASRYDRMDWIEAEYARTSGAVTKTLKERRCARCVGEGELSVSRRGIDCVAKCPRCHGAKLDQSVEYQ